MVILPFTKIIRLVFILILYIKIIRNIFTIFSPLLKIKKIIFFYLTNYLQNSISIFKKIQANKKYFLYVSEIRASQQFFSIQQCPSFPFQMKYFTFKNILCLISTFKNMKISFVILLIFQKILIRNGKSYKLFRWIKFWTKSIILFSKCTEFKILFLELGRKIHFK